MDGWKYAAKSGRKESGFENLKTRFQDCNLSGKQENKPDGMIEKKQAFNRERKQVCKESSPSLWKDGKKRSRQGHKKARK